MIRRLSTEVAHKSCGDRSEGKRWSSESTTSFPSLVGRPDSDAFADPFAIVDAAERWGLDVMWLAELHFDPARSVLSAPLCIASAIAARTTRIKIGIAVQVLPLCNPLRIAEEAATVDQISRGRLIFGVGRSGVAKTYEAYNVPYTESRPRFAETLDIIQQAWSNPTRFLLRDLLQLSGCRGHAPPVPAVRSADPYCRRQRRLLPDDRPSGQTDLPRRQIRRGVRTQYSGLPGCVAGGRTSGRGLGAPACARLPGRDACHRAG